jgi:cystathionine beta-lyase/cystathionine gamma-synthase
MKTTFDPDSWAPETQLVHPVKVPLPVGNEPLVAPVYHSAKFSPSEGLSPSEQFVYGRVSNPTTRQLELTLARLQRREDCIVVGSGIAALTGTFLGLLSAGDHVITFRELYKPARQFIREQLPRFGVEHSVLPLDRLDLLAATIRAKRTKLIHFESPTNPNLNVADIPRLTEIAREHGVLVSMDGTFAGLHQHFDGAADVMIQSLTKFGNGHGDVIAGSIAGPRELVGRIRTTTQYLGAHLDPQAAYLIQRGLKTYHLRYQRQSETAGVVARYLEGHPGVARVRYPGLPSHPQHDRSRAQLLDFGAVVAFELAARGGVTAETFCHRLSLIQLAASIGSTESIICPTLAFFGADLAPAELTEMGLNAYSLRLSVGLEDPADLIADLAANLPS